MRTVHEHLKSARLASLGEKGERLLMQKEELMMRKFITVEKHQLCLQSKERILMAQEERLSRRYERDINAIQSSLKAERG